MAIKAKIIPAKPRTAMKAFGTTTAIIYAGKTVIMEEIILRNRALGILLANMALRESHKPTPTPRTEVTMASREIHQTRS